MTILLIIPTYNERLSLDALLARIVGLPSLYHICLIDDASPDGTGAVADHWADQYPERIHVIHRHPPRSFAGALAAGFAYGLAHDYDILVQLDADGSHDPVAIPRLVAALHHADVVIGSRYVSGGSTPGWSLSRRLLSRLGGWYAQLWLGWSIQDGTSGFKAWRRDTMQSVDWSAIHGTGFVCQIEMLYQAWRQGRRVTEVPIVFHDRQQGYSKMSGAVIREALSTIPQLPRRLPRQQAVQPVRPCVSKKP